MKRGVGVHSPRRDRMNKAIPEHVWLAAVRIVRQFYAITPQERWDKGVVIEEAERQP